MRIEALTGAQTRATGSADPYLRDRKPAPAGSQTRAKPGAQTRENGSANPYLDAVAGAQAPGEQGNIRVYSEQDN